MVIAFVKSRNFDVTQYNGNTGIIKQGDDYFDTYNLPPHTNITGNLYYDDDHEVKFPQGINVVGAILFRNNKSITNAANIPPCNELSFHSCDNFNSFEGAPENINALGVINCKSLKDLEGIPEAKHVYILESDITSLKEMKNCEILEIHNAPKLESLKDIPVVSKKIHISNCGALNDVSDLKDSDTCTQVDINLSEFKSPKEARFAFNLAKKPPQRPLRRGALLAGGPR